MTLIRREAPDDRKAVYAIQRAAFENAPHSSGGEADLVEALRESEDWSPRLSLVAEVDGRIAGHVVSTYGRIGDERVLGLGPIGVGPEFQGLGLGSALMHAAIAGADALDEPAIVLLGEPKFYGRFGFVPAERHGITAPDPNWGPYFQVRLLSNRREDLKGRFTYSPAFDRFG